MNPPSNRAWMSQQGRSPAVKPDKETRQRIVLILLRKYAALVV